MAEAPSAGTSAAGGDEHRHGDGVPTSGPPEGVARAADAPAAAKKPKRSSLAAMLGREGGIPTPRLSFGSRNAAQAEPVFSSVMAADESDSDAISDGMSPTAAGAPPEASPTSMSSHSPMSEAHPAGVGAATAHSPPVSSPLARASKYADVKARPSAATNSAKSRSQPRRRSSQSDRSCRSGGGEGAVAPAAEPSPATAATRDKFEDPSAATPAKKPIATVRTVPVDTDGKKKPSPLMQFKKTQLMNIRERGLSINTDPGVDHLSRGGYVVDTSVGAIQFGVPPETIKDHMSLGREVPQHYVIPEDPFVRDFGPSQGLNIGEFEFPAYFNFFLRKRQVNLVVPSMEVEERIRRVFQETLLGPPAGSLNVADDYDEGFPVEARADLEKELAYFGKFGDVTLSVDMLLRFTHFNSHGVAYITNDTDEGAQARAAAEGGVCIMKTTDSYVVQEADEVVARVTDAIEIDSPVPPRAPSSTPFKPPVFGVTVLGASHGFDASGSTSGYVLWVNRRGIMIDPPPNSSDTLREQNIPPKLIEAVIVTHCHADHDAGTFQKVLQEGRVTLLTTRTIMSSFLRKYSALSGLDKPFLEQIFSFRPVLIGTSMHMRGAQFRFFYSLHSIPCIGFECTYAGKRIVFSGDHLNDATKINALHEQGVISAGRRDELLAFPWDADLILHEAGVPPIHTPMATLVGLPDDVKSRLRVVHVAPKDIPGDSGLIRAEAGVENTIELMVEPPVDADVTETLDMLGGIDLFSSLTMRHAREVLQLFKRTSVKAGQTIIEKESGGDTFFVIARGVAQGEVQMKVVSGAPQHGTTQGNAAHAVASPLTPTKRMHRLRSPAWRRMSSSWKTVTTALDTVTRFERQRSRLADGRDGATSPGGAGGAGGPTASPPARSPSSQANTPQVAPAGAAGADADASSTGDASTFSVMSFVKTYSAGDYFGEAALVETGAADVADVVAVTDVELLSIRRRAFRWLLQGTDVLARITRLIEAIDSGAWEVFANNSCLSRMSTSQKTQLSELCERKEFSDGQFIWKAGDPARFAFLIDAGSVRYDRVLKQTGTRPVTAATRIPRSGPAQLVAGAFVADVTALVEGKAHAAGLMAAEESVLLVIKRDDLLVFFRQNPGLWLSLTNAQFVV